MGAHICNICGSSYTRKDKLIAHGSIKHPQNQELFQKRKILTEAERKSHKKQWNAKRSIKIDPEIALPRGRVATSYKSLEQVGMIEFVPITETKRYQEFLVWREAKLRSIAIAKAIIEKRNQEKQ